MAANKTAIIGIDLGTSESYVAFVGRGIVDIVQNEVSKRATPTLVGFTDRERLLGDSALAQIKSNAKNTCRNFKHLLGRKLEAPDLSRESFWSTSKLTSTEDQGFAGYEVNYKGTSRDMSAVQVTAAYFTKLREITEKWCTAKVSDVVISVPSYFSHVQRQAVMDSAKIAGLTVLRLMNEHTATALAYGIYRSNDFDPEKPMNVAFCSMGHALFSVCIVQFTRGKLKVLCENSDLIGGRDMDECLMREFAAQFKKKNNLDALANKKSVLKLEDAVTKTKKVLSANSEAPCTVECLVEDYDFSSTINRQDFEAMCEPAIAKAKAVLEAAKAASPVPLDQVDFVEIVGGATRVPWVKRICSEAFGGKPLSTTMNQEESVARGCALQAAILSPLYKVREFAVEDNCPFSINVGWVGSAADAQAKKEEDGDTEMAGGEGENKSATVFPEGSPMNLLKMLTFYRVGPFDLKAEYADDKRLLPLTPRELGSYRIELPQQTEPKRVKVKAKLTLHGTFSIEGAQLVEEEEYEETVKEQRELPADPDDAAEEDEEEMQQDGEEAAPAAKAEEGDDKSAAKEDEAEKEPAPAAEDGAKKGEEEEATTATEGDAADKEGAEDGNKKDEEAPKDEEATKTENKEPEVKEPAKPRVPKKKYEWVDVVKKKRRTKRIEVPITICNQPGLTEDLISKRMDEEFAVQADMRDILETDERRNDLESYIFNMRDKISEHNEYGPFISGVDRENFSKALTAAEDWLYDNPESTKAQYVEKVEELKCTGDPVVWRFKESGMRSDWIAAVHGTVRNYRAAAENPGDKYGHIAGEKLAKIVAACAELEKWLNDMKAKQEAMPSHEKPTLICADMEKKNQELAKMADEILREPRPPPPPKPEKKEEEAPKATEEKADEGAPQQEEQKDGGAVPPPPPPPAAEENGPRSMDVD